MAQGQYKDKNKYISCQLKWISKKSVMIILYQKANVFLFKFLTGSDTS